MPDPARFADELPEWFTGPRPGGTYNRLAHPCGKCGAPASEQCRRLTWDGRNLIGSPCQPHKERGRRDG